jgi:FlaA1/EpsC-like NDP-sugar epimerase
MSLPSLNFIDNNVCTGHIIMRQLRQLRNRHLFIFDLLLLPLAAYLSYVLRLERLDLGSYWDSYFLFSLVAVIVTTIVFKAVGLYARYWRYASIDELLLLTGATTFSVIGASAVAAVLSWLFAPGFMYPRSIPLIFLLLVIVATAGPRLLLRLLGSYQNGRNRQSGLVKPVLVVGAGDAGAMIVREMRQNPGLGLYVVGLIDDDPRKHGMSIHGVPVLGSRQQIPLLVPRLRIKQVIIAIPAASGKTIREIVAICEKTAVSTKIMPGIYEILDGTVSINQLRDIDIEDLLRREPVATDIEAMQKTVQGKRVLVTGGGGSIGSELCRQILRCRPSELILLGHGENSIFEIYNELRRWQVAGTIIRPAIADVRSAERIHTVLAQFKPQIVFHAAAHKHVPLMELNPAEAVTNNVLGTRNVLQAAQALGVERFVMISTDKAVNPTSIMGASKRVAELLVHQAAAETGLPYVAVRFGNVLGSRGSVVLTFKKQIARGGPVTVTSPEMTRYFMTIPEAVQLVLQAAVLGQGGEVFVLDMGDPVKIIDLARDIIELSGLEVGRDIDIEIIGSRPGEKLYEELFAKGEVYHHTPHQKVYIAGNASSLVPHDLAEAVDALEASATRNDRLAIVRGFQSLVPEYTPLEAPTSDAVSNEPATPEPMDKVYKVPPLSPAPNYQHNPLGG